MSHDTRCLTAVQHLGDKISYDLSALRLPGSDELKVQTPWYMNFNNPS